MRRKPEPQAAGSDPVNANKKEQRVERPADASARQSYSSILINFGKCLLLIVIVPPFLNYASLQREGQMLLPKDGQMVDVGLGQKLHLLCKGRGKPAVILDAPTGMSSDVWVHVQEKLSSLTKVCTYDRMGLGFSKRLMQNETTGTEKVWGASTTGRMVDDLHRLLQAAGIATPFVLVGSELGALNSRFYSHIHDSYGKLLPSLQARQFSAATGLSRLLIILGAVEPMLKGENVSEEVIQRQKYLLSNPAHQSSAVDEHYFMNESVAQVGDITKFKPLSSRISVSMLTGDSFDEQMPQHLNQMVAEHQKRFLKESYPSANHVHIKGADRRMIYKKPSAVSQHLWKLVSQRQAGPQSE
uniref:Si:dkey-122a22.2 n=1 Tax=Xiphophorus maculatus TaxID=8083 RepID=A0A3B5QAQ6_XIPMA